MSDHAATPHQVARISLLVEQHGMDDMTRFRRLRTITGRPINALRQLTYVEADRVIAELAGDIQQPALPGMEAT